MEWLLPAGAWAFSGLLVVIALYILRRKAIRHDVPSLLLWQKTESAQEASKPFQRLRKQWLLFLQLLLVTLLAFALLRPALPGGFQGEWVLIMDLSASMQAQAEGKSRLDLAVEDAVRLVDGLAEGDAVTVLTAGATVGQAITRSTEKQRVRAALLSLEAENGGAAVESALSLAKAMRRDVPALSILLYTDSYSSSGEGLQIRAVGTGADNRSIASLRCSPQGEGLLAFARIDNHGQAAQVTVECYADGALCDLKTLALEADAQTSVQFAVPISAQSCMVALQTPDALAVDNVRYWVVQPQRQRRVLLVSQGNVFLEKALALRPDVQLLKTTAADEGQMDGYDLVILDGQLPSVLPQTGSLLVFSPGAEVLGISPGKETKADGALRAQNNDLAQTLTRNLLLSEFSLRSFRPLSGGQSILTFGNHTLLAAAQQQGRRAAVLGFDLHDSNLPMKPDFPILMQNLLDYLLPDAVGAVEAAYAGQPITLALDERTESAQVITPSGEALTVAGDSFTDTQPIGIYALRENRADGTQRVTPFTLHMDPAEADVRQVAVSTAREQTGQAQRHRAGQELTAYVLLAMLALLMVEWGVSRRGA